LANSGLKGFVLWTSVLAVLFCGFERRDVRSPPFSNGLIVLSLLGVSVIGLLLIQPIDVRIFSRLFEKYAYFPLPLNPSVNISKIAAEFLSGKTTRVYR